MTKLSLKDIDTRLRRLEVEQFSETSTCILNEGAIKLFKNEDITAFQFENEILKDSYVSYSRDKNNKILLCRNVPVVELSSVNGYEIIGKCTSITQLRRLPESEDDSNTILKRLEGDFFRLGYVKILYGFDKEMIGEYNNVCPNGWTSGR